MVGRTRPLAGRSSPLPLALVALALVACGGDGSGEPRLTAPERADLARSRAAVVAYCRRIGLYLAGRRGPPGEADKARAGDATDTLIALVERKPRAEYLTDETVTVVVGDLAERLEAINCAPDLERRLEVALSGLPPG
jgi:hypothetical protein